MLYQPLHTAISCTRLDTSAGKMLPGSLNDLPAELKATMGGGTTSAPTDYEWDSCLRFAWAASSMQVRMLCLLVSSCIMVACDHPRPPCTGSWCIWLQAAAAVLAMQDGLAAAADSRAVAAAPPPSGRLLMAEASWAGQPPGRGCTC